jgi:hypothetical protein
VRSPVPAIRAPQRTLAVSVATRTSTSTSATGKYAVIAPRSRFAAWVVK